jgi:hypothetical protein
MFPSNNSVQSNIQGLKGKLFHADVEGWRDKRGRGTEKGR